MVVVGVNFRETQVVVQDFIDTFGVTFPVLLDPVGETYMTYSNGGMSPFPLDYVIDQDGIIQYIATEYNPQEIIQVIEELLGITPPPVLTMTCLAVDDHVPEGGYLPFEVTITNNTETDIPADDYELMVEHFARTSCSVLTDPVFVHTITPGAVLPPGPMTFRFDVGPLPEGTAWLSPLATRISTILLDPVPQVTDECCFSWWADAFPVHRELLQTP